MTDVLGKMRADAEAAGESVPPDGAKEAIDEGECQKDADLKKRELA